MTKQTNIVQAIAFSIGFLESELPEGARPSTKRLTPFQREIARNAAALRELHRQLSPLGDRLAALDRDTGKEAVRSNFNAGPPVW